MNGISLKRILEHEKIAFHIEKDFQVAYQHTGEDMWIFASESHERCEAMMAAIEEEVGGVKLTGFTLFRNNRDKWQMSTRREGTTGWSIVEISDEQTARLFSMLGPVSHPEGPLKVLATARPTAAPVADPSASLMKAVQGATIARDGLTKALAAWTAR